MQLISLLLSLISVTNLTILRQTLTFVMYVCIYKNSLNEKVDNNNNWTVYISSVVLPTVQWPCSIVLALMRVLGLLLIRKIAYGIV